MKDIFKVLSGNGFIIFHSSFSLAAQPNMSSNHYETLGVRQSDTDAAIRRAAQAASDQIGADKSLTLKAREDRLAEVQVAAAVLTTPSNRDQYDATLRMRPASTVSIGKMGILASPLAWITLAAIAATGGGLYWQHERDQTRLRVERERVVTEQQTERRAKDFEAQRIVEKERLLAELRSQRENDDKHRQQFNEMRSADTRNKSYVVDDRLVPPPPTNNYATNYEIARRSYEDQHQLSGDAQRRALEETRQRYEDAVNLQRARAEVDRQKRYLEQNEREEQYARAQREAASRPSRY